MVADAGCEELPSGRCQAPLLRVSGLCAGYQRPVVGPVGFTLRRGEVLGLAGANGCGKSTLLAAIGAGARIFAGVVERAPGLRLAVQPQQPASRAGLPITGRELLRLAGVGSQRRWPWSRPASAMGHPPVAPAALAPLLPQRIDRLSGGQYQLLAVFAALGAGADLVLLDEPTNNLDPQHEDLLLDLLRAQAVSRGVLLVSHERGFLRQACTSVIEINGYGTIAAV